MSAAPRSFRDMSADELTLLIETTDGMIATTIRAATELPRVDDKGIEVEESSRNSAAMWGMPDFMFKPVHEQSGSGVREVGDGALISGSDALMIQVKSRLEEGSEPERERAWLVKNIARALRQGDGSIRRLRRGLTSMRNLRERTVVIDGNDYKWMSVVIVEHNDIPDGFIPDLRSAAPAVVLTRRDWEFLFNHLRSTRSVCEYLLRVADEQLPLGDEPVRYHELALADLAAEPTPAPSWVDPNAVTFSVPRAPLTAAGAEDSRAHRLLRVVQEDIALSSLGPGQELHRIDMLSHIDSIPVASRTELGNRLFNYMSDCFNMPDHADLRTGTRIYMPNDETRGPVLFMVASRLDEMTKSVFRARFDLLHHDYCRDSGDERAMTVAVLLTPRRNGERPWDTTMVAVDGIQVFDERYIEHIRRELSKSLVEPAKFR